jgi:hypothetical protein
VSRHTIRDYLPRVALELEALRTFKHRLGDSLAPTLAKCGDLEDTLLDALNDEAVLSTLSTAEKERWEGSRLPKVGHMLHGGSKQASPHRTTPTKYNSPGNAIQAGIEW